MSAKIISCLLALTGAPLAAWAAPVPPQFVFPFGETQHVVVRTYGGQPASLPSRCLALVGTGRSTYELVTLCTRDEIVLVRKDEFGTQGALDAALKELGGPESVGLFDADPLPYYAQNLNLRVGNGEWQQVHSPGWGLLPTQEGSRPGVLCLCIVT